jgi:4-hydroxy-3-polyprenylbenzoate decarboxylase
MTMAAEMGAHLLPPVPSFYHQPETIDDIINQTIGKIFDYLGINHALFTRWGEKGKSGISRKKLSIKQSSS